jgi:hypothetical protein
MITVTVTFLVLLKNGDRAYIGAYVGHPKIAINRHSVLEGRGGGLQDIVE